MANRVDQLRSQQQTTDILKHHIVCSPSEQPVSGAILVLYFYSDITSYLFFVAARNSLTLLRTLRKPPEGLEKCQPSCACSVNVPKVFLSDKQVRNKLGYTSVA
jgi:hypothetical protein